MTVGKIIHLDYYFCGQEKQGLEILKIYPPDLGKIIHLDYYFVVSREVVWRFRIEISNPDRKFNT